MGTSRTSRAPPFRAGTLPTVSVASSPRMPSCSKAERKPDEIRRAQPWLGTLVEITVRAPKSGSGNRRETRTVLTRAAQAGFQAIAQVHRLMSFHEAQSDLARFNAAKPFTPVTVHPWTARVIRFALRVAAA